MYVPSDVINVRTAKSVIYGVNLVVFRLQHVFVSIILKTTEASKILIWQTTLNVLIIHMGGFLGE
jgi:hypothetical protein